MTLLFIRRVFFCKNHIDIDHDYVHELEENLAKLEEYIATKEKPEALATMLLIHETWEDIVSL